MWLTRASRGKKEKNQGTPHTHTTFLQSPLSALPRKPGLAAQRHSTNQMKNFLSP
eukprot:m.233760 g.233760  ORF g.233760 m.233760 type:complete len:55 (+) comp22459_c3_seq4:142-306(+)